ncbi:MAG: adenylyltransferase/cytidyltransferase family protein [Parcubacteria group bacterium]|nr:adenylyltransferase/cytidyltransferase family protein [Parcubacteria group bacterium]
MAYISYDDLPIIRQQSQNKKIVLCTGTFDLTHAGHALFFEDCKQYGDILVVAVGSDAIIKKYKGANRPILNEHIRLKSVDSLKSVDYCFLDTLTPEHVWLDEKILDLLRPDIYIINKDAPYKEMREEATSKRGIRMVVLDRQCPTEFENISTMGIIKKIKKLL